MKHVLDSLLRFLPPNNNPNKKLVSRFNVGGCLNIGAEDYEYQSDVCRCRYALSGAISYWMLICHSTFRLPFPGYQMHSSIYMHVDYVFHFVNLLRFCNFNLLCD